MNATTKVRARCRQGHDYTPENTIHIPDERAPSGRRRQCRTCKNAARRIRAADLRLPLPGQP